MTIIKRTISQKPLNEQCSCYDIYAIKALGLVVLLGIVPNVLASAKPSQYQTHVIHTYGGANLIPLVEQQLRDYGGGSVSAYQDKLVIRSNDAGYRAVQSLLQDIDKPETPLKLSIRVDQAGQYNRQQQQGQVVINTMDNTIGSSSIGNTSRHTIGAPIRRSSIQVGAQGVFRQDERQYQQQSNYQVSTLSNHPAHISTNTLISLAPSLSHNPYGYLLRVNPQTVINIQSGITVKPVLLPNNQVKIEIYQTEQIANIANNTATIHNNRSFNRINGLQTESQQLATTVTIPRGQWTSIGEISRNTQMNSIGDAQQSNQFYPVQIKVD